MIQWNLRIKMLLVIGLVIFVVLGTSAYVQKTDDETRFSRYD